MNSALPCSSTPACCRKQMQRKALQHRRGTFTPAPGGPLKFPYFQLKTKPPPKTPPRCLMAAQASWLGRSDGEGDILSSFSRSRAELGQHLNALFPAAQQSLQENFCFGVNADTQPFPKNLSWEVYVLLQRKPGDEQWNPVSNWEYPGHAPKASVARGPGGGQWHSLHEVPRGLLVAELALGCVASLC